MSGIQLDDPIFYWRDKQLRISLGTYRRREPQVG